MLYQRRTPLRKLAKVLQINVICLDFNSLVEIIMEIIVEIIVEIIMEMIMEIKY